MKKIFLLTALCCAFAISNAQHTTPRFPYENGKVAKGDVLKYQTETKTGIAAADTVWLSPNAWQTYFYIQGLDTLPGNIYVDLADAVRSNVTFTDNNCYLLDNFTLMYKAGKLRADTIRFLGNMYYGSTNYIAIPADSVSPYHQVPFWFNGTKFVRN
jgi:hypothetical protein